MTYRDAKKYGHSGHANPPENWRGIMKPVRLKIKLSDLAHIQCFEDIISEFETCNVEFDRTMSKLYVVTSPIHIASHDNLWTEGGSERTFSLKYLLNIDG